MLILNKKCNLIEDLVPVGVFVDGEASPVKERSQTLQGTSEYSPSSVPPPSLDLARAPNASENDGFQECKPLRGKPGRKRRTIFLCQYCQVDLSQERSYYQRYRICRHCASKEYIQIDGIKQRFCQQCGRFQNVALFDANQRTCRERLERHAARRRKTKVTSLAKNWNEDDDTDSNLEQIDGDLPPGRSAHTEVYPDNDAFGPGATQLRVDPQDDVLPAQGNSYTSLMCAFHNPLIRPRVVTFSRGRCVGDVDPEQARVQLHTALASIQIFPKPHTGHVCVWRHHLGSERAHIAYDEASVLPAQPNAVRHPPVVGQCQDSGHRFFEAVKTASMKPTYIARPTFDPASGAAGAIAQLATQQMPMASQPVAQIPPSAVNVGPHGAAISGITQLPDAHAANAIQSLLAVLASG